MIVDASIIVKWINVNEPNCDEALLLYKNHIEKKEQICVPQLLFLEVANFLATKSNTSEENIIESLSFLYDSNLKICEVTKDSLIEASILAKKYKTSVYDMLYAVLAKQNDTILITADKRFSRSVNFSFVHLLSE